MYIYIYLYAYIMDGSMSPVQEDGAGAGGARLRQGGYS